MCGLYDASEKMRIAIFPPKCGLEHGPIHHNPLRTGEYHLHTGELKSVGSGFRRGCQTPKVTLDFNRAWKKLSTPVKKPSRHLIEEAWGGLSLPHQPPRCATWPLPYHL